MNQTNSTKIQSVNIRFKKLNPDAITPSYGTPQSAGADLYSADENITILPGQSAFIHTGLALEIPSGLVGLIYARSSLACKHGISPANKVGVIDSDYRGEIIVALHNHSENEFEIKKGDRVAQIVFTPYFAAQFCEVDKLDDTRRGSGGFGSTGK